VTDHDSKPTPDSPSPSGRPSLYDQKRHERMEAIFARVKADIESQRDLDVSDRADDGVPDWLDLTNEHTAEQWEAACDKVLRDNEPTEEPGDPPVRAGSIVTCPLDPSWRRLDVFVPARRHDLVPPEAIPRILEARRVPGNQKLQTLDLVWEVADDDASIAPATDDPRSFDPHTPSHVHADCTIADHHVHIDATAARLWGPGRSWLEVRIFVDGHAEIVHCARTGNRRCVRPSRMIGLRIGDVADSMSFIQPSLQPSQTTLVTCSIERAFHVRSGGPSGRFDVAVPV
jgi:hypothetical protein